MSRMFWWKSMASGTRTPASLNRMRFLNSLVAQAMISLKCEPCMPLKRGSPSMYLAMLWNVELETR